MKYLLCIILLACNSLLAQFPEVPKAPLRPENLESDMPTVQPGDSLTISWDQYNQDENNALIAWNNISFGLGFKDSRATGYETQEANFVPDENTKIDVWAYPGRVDVTVWTNIIDDNGNILASSQGSNPPVSFMFEVPGSEVPGGGGEGGEGGGTEEIILEKKSFTIIATPNKKEE